MPREYVRRVGGRVYGNYTKEAMKDCLDAVESGMPKKTASRIYKIPVRTITDKLKGLHPNKPGAQMVFSEEEEHHIANLILRIAAIGYPITCVDLRHSLAAYLNSKGTVIQRFNNNVPGKEWAVYFKKRHEILSNIQSLNVRVSKINISRMDVETWIDKIREIVDEVSSHVSSESAQLAANIGLAFLQHLERKHAGETYSQPRKKRNARESVNSGDSEDTVNLELNTEMIDLPVVTASLSPAADFSPTEIIIEIDDDVKADIASGSQEFSSGYSVVVEDENLLTGPESQDYSVGDYVVVKDNDNLFPGQIESVQDDGLIVKCMKRGRKAWKWPVEGIEITMSCQFHQILFKKLDIKEQEGEIFLQSIDGYHVIL